MGLLIIFLIVFGAIVYLKDDIDLLSGDKDGFN